jgi:hypothetical protein
MMRTGRSYSGYPLEETTSANRGVDEGDTGRSGRRPIRSRVEQEGGYGMMPSRWISSKASRIWMARSDRSRTVGNFQGSVSPWRVSML